MPEGLDRATLEKALGALDTTDVMLPDPAAYAIEGVVPAFAMRPTTQQDVAVLLAVAEAAGAAVVPWGGGTQQSLGMPPERYDIALDLRGLDKVIEYTPADLTVTVEAGMTMSALDEVLSEQGQWLAIEPPLPRDTTTIGGVLATNASGPSRLGHGTARDLLIGITFALPSGELVKSGGRVVKNVAGYDMGKLQIGALGTLGVITQATFKLAPEPGRTEFCWVHAPMAKLMSIIKEVGRSLLAIDVLAVTNEVEGADWSLRVRFFGGHAAVERSLREFQAFTADGDPSGKPSFDDPDDVHIPSLFSAPVLARAFVLPTTLPSICQAFAARGARVIAYANAGIVYGAWDELKPDIVRELRKLCVESGRGALVLERGPLELKRAAGVWGEPRDDFELMGRIKHELDPKGVLNPGRYIGGI